MKNTRYETGLGFVVRSRTPESQKHTLAAAPGVSQEPTGGIHTTRWKDPQASGKLIRQLMTTVNSSHECQELRRDLAELDRLFPSPSSLMKGGAAHHAVDETWLQ
jgi:hypothetical protein